MTLIKCTECTQEISTEARECPHCGNPIEKGLSIWKSISLFILILAFFGLIISLTSSIQNPSKFRELKNFLTQILNRGLFLSTDTIPPTGNPKQVPIREVNNLGYVFLLGEIEESRTTNITDDFKNQITKIAYTTSFPKELLKVTPIVIINNLALSSDLYISTPNGNLKVPELGGHFLSEGGLYASYPNNAVIYINKTTLTSKRLTEVLAHEFGHAIGAKMTDQEWAKFYQLRNIPNGADKSGTSWNMSPQEDFAEVYKYTFTGLVVRTYWGFIEPMFGDTDLTGACQKIYFDLQSEYSPKADLSNPLNFFTNSQNVDFESIQSKISADHRIQNCRRDVMANPSKYQSEWGFVTPYKSYVNQATKDFIVGVAERINK